MYIKLEPYSYYGKVILTLPGLTKRIVEYRKAVRNAIGLMNMHRAEDHDDMSDEYYTRHDLSDLAEALEALPDDIGVVDTNKPE